MYMYCAFSAQLATILLLDLCLFMHSYYGRFLNYFYGNYKWMLLLFGTDLLFIYFPVKGTESMYVSSCSDLKYSRMLVACGIGLQKTMCA